MNDSYIGEFSCFEVPGAPDDIAFFMGDPDDEGSGYGAAMWDDFTVTGTDYVPEPGGLLALASGLLGFIGWFRRTRA